MTLIYRIDINLFAMASLLFVGIIGYARLDKKDTVNNLFLIAALIVFLELANETITCVLNGKTDAILIGLAYLFNVLLFLMAPILTFSFFVLIRKILFPYEPLTKKLLLLSSIPAGVSAVLSLLTPFFGFYFSIDSLGVYTRGPLFLVSAIITYVYLLVIVVYIRIKRPQLRSKDAMLFCLVATLPVVGGILQSAFYGVLFMWSSAAMALIIGFIFMQDRMVRLDALTGCWTRESFFFTFSRKIAYQPNDVFGAIYFDVDNLKQINDSYGHLEGDNALSKTAQWVRNCLSADDFIARIGGDEFIAIVHVQDKQKLLKHLDCIKKTFDANNLAEKTPYSIRCSFGADLYTNQFSSLELFLHHIDHLMYQEKNQKREQKQS